MNLFPAVVQSEPKRQRHLFTAKEDALLSSIVAETRYTSWTDVAERMPGRSARQCRDRWTNYLCPANKNGPWTEEEDALLAQKVRDLGSHWSVIAKCFDGRSENNVKNRWYAFVRARQADYPSPEPAPKRQPFPSIASLLHSVCEPAIPGGANCNSRIDPSAFFPALPCFI
jgi:hypothetical protein